MLEFDELGDVVEFGVVGELGDVGDVEDDDELDLTEFLVLGCWDDVDVEVEELGLFGEVDGVELVGPVCVPGAIAVRGPRGAPGTVGEEFELVFELELELEFDWTPVVGADDVGD